MESSRSVDMGNVSMEEGESGSYRLKSVCPGYSSNSDECCGGWIINLETDAG
jgi:hypothetical protein